MIIYFKKAIITILMKIINRTIWGQVKNYATVNKFSLPAAVAFLLKKALISEGYTVREEWLPLLLWDSPSIPSPDCKNQKS